MLTVQAGRLMRWLVLVLALCPSSVAGAGISAIAVPVSTAPSGNTLAAVPFAGFNTWYAQLGNPTQAYYQSTSDFLVSSGLQAAWGGTVTAGIDEGWQATVSNTVTRDGSNHPVPSANWSSMPTATAHIKANGQVPLMYRDPGQTGCMNENWGAVPIATDTDYFVQSWGFQGIKVDGCGIGTGSARDIYTGFKTHMDTLGIQYVLTFGYSAIYGGTNYNGYTQTSIYGPRAGTAWRLSYDIGGATTACQTSWDNNAGGGNGTVVNNLWAYTHHPGTVGPYHFPDMDYLMAQDGTGSLSTNEAVSQMAIWAVVSTPWVLGCDPTKLGTTELATLKNADLISILHDPWVYGGRRIFGEAGSPWGANPSDEHYCKRLAGTGKRAIVAINENTAAAGTNTMTINPALCGIDTTQPYTYKNVLTGATTTGHTGTFSTGAIPSHASGVYLITGTESNNLCWGTNPGGTGQVADGFPGGCAFTKDSNGGAGDTNVRVGGFPLDGTTISTATAISTTGVTNPAPQGCYQQQRIGVIVEDPHEAGIEYIADNLVAGATYHYRLHMAEIQGNTTGQRLFNMTINTGAQQVAALSSYDIYASAGAANKAVVVEGNVVADHGYLSFDYEPLSPPVGMPTVGCIEVIKQ